MFTSIDKAIVAFLGAILFFITEFTELEASFVSEELLQSAGAVLTAILVYLVPDKPKS